MFQALQPTQSQSMDALILKEVGTASSFPEHETHPGKQPPARKNGINQLSCRFVLLAS
jgi:hypothetical protein